MTGTFFVFCDRRGVINVLRSFFRFRRVIALSIVVCVGYRRGQCFCPVSYSRRSSQWRFLLLYFSTSVFVVGQWLAGHYWRCCLFFDRTCLSAHHAHTDEWRFVVSSSPRKCLHILCMLPRTLCLIVDVSVRDPWLGRMSGLSLVVWRRIEYLGLDELIRWNVGSSFSLDRFVRRWMDLRIDLMQSIFLTYLIMDRWSPVRNDRRKKLGIILWNTPSSSPTHPTFYCFTFRWKR